MQTMTTSEFATVLAWHDALIASDLDTLVALSSDDIDIGDAHGAVQGHAALRRWAASVETTAAELGRMYVHDGIVVVELNDAALAFVARASAIAVPNKRAFMLTPDPKVCRNILDPPFLGSLFVILHSKNESTRIREVTWELG